MSLFHAYPEEERKHRRFRLEGRILFIVAGFVFIWMGVSMHNIPLLIWGFLNNALAGLV